MMSMSLPGLVVEMLIPSTFEGLVWWGMGGGLARAVGKQLDQDIQGGEWFTGLPVWAQSFVKRGLDFLHHWWVGALLMLYGSGWLPQYPIQVYWIGAGVFVDDLPDLFKRVRAMLSTIATYMGE